MKKQSLILACAAVLVAPSVMAADYPTKAFDARYLVTNPQGKSDLRMASDGKGHFLTQTIASGYQSTTIVDYLTNTSTTLIEQGKIAMKSKLPPNGGYVADDASVKKAGGKSIGNKVVEGHPCHGFEYSASGSKSQVWIGDDCKILVQSTTETPVGKVVMSLKSVANAPAPGAFTVPAGYKTMSQ